jgi:APA family basic amino acid/polyamine antiporter
MPQTGGEYAYLRECYHPLVGFLFGWVLLLVVMTGGMAAVAVTFARYFLTLTGLGVSERAVVVLTLALLTIVNCLGAKLGSRVQSLLMVMKIVVIAGVILTGFFLIRHPFAVLHPVLPPAAERGSSFGLLTAFGAAMLESSCSTWL